MNINNVFKLDCSFQDFPKMLKFDYWRKINFFLDFFPYSNFKILELNR